MINEVKPYLRKEIVLISTWILKKKKVKVVDIENLIKAFYARDVPRKRKILKKMNIKEFEKQMKSAYKV